MPGKKRISRNRTCSAMSNAAKGKTECKDLKMLKDITIRVPLDSWL
jgi:hypothetical protein